jgi:hypothetical protein
MKIPSFYLSEETYAPPKNYIGELRKHLRSLGPPPACLHFAGCRRLVYRAACQIGVKITVRKQKNGTFLIWKVPITEIAVPKSTTDGDSI